jgi:hypothetical protein
MQITSPIVSAPESLKFKQVKSNLVVEKVPPSLPAQRRAPPTNIRGKTTHEGTCENKPELKFIVY